MTKTQIYNFGEPLIGYMVNTALDRKNQAKILELQQNINKKFPGAIWIAPQESLHVTLLDWVAPLVDYGRDKDKIFQEKFGEYDSAIGNVVRKLNKPITVMFDEVVAFPAAIIVKGKDDGSYQKIRSEFVENVELLPNTKLPPNIIHCSIARFKKEIDFAQVESFVSDLKFSFEHITNQFRLVRETKDPMVEFETIKTYS